MERKDRVDAFGALSLIGFSALLGFNQVVIRVVNEGLQPVFFAGLRSVGAVALVLLWFHFKRKDFGLHRSDLGPGLLIGVFFALEFTLLFTSLDLTSVARASIVFYTMPLWLALMAHVMLPGETITPVKALGLLLAFCGVAVVILWRADAGDASFAGDVMALGASMCWAGIALVARTGLKHVSPDRQLIWQLLVSAPLLLVAALFFGPFVRELAPIHLWGLAFQIVVVAALGFGFWLWLLSIYPAASVAAFSFLSPIFGVAFGWLLLGEALGPAVRVSLVLVCAGLILINRPSHVPQKVR